MRVVDRIRVPAADHHGRRRSVRAAASRSTIRSVAGNPHITAAALEARRPLRLRRPAARRDDDGYWAEQQIVDFAAARS